MTITYRQGLAADGLSVTAVWAESAGHVNTRHGFGDRLPSTARANPFFAFASEQEPEGFWVAEEDGEIVGFASSLVYGSLWYLSYLFIRPAIQSRGVGRQLIERALTPARTSDVTNRALITFAYNPTSIALYLRYGLYPREPLYAMAGSPAAVTAHLKTEVTGLTPEEASADADTILQLGVVDGRAMGMCRDALHRYLLARADGGYVLFREGRDLKGYAYITRNGRVGPLAVQDPMDLGSVMRTSLSMAADQDGVERVAALIPGSNESAMAVALEAQLRIVSPYLLMSSRPFAGSASYLFHSPPLM